MKNSKLFNGMRPRDVRLESNSLADSIDVRPHSESKTVLCISISSLRDDVSETLIAFRFLRADFSVSFSIMGS